MGSPALSLDALRDMQGHCTMPPEHARMCRRHFARSARSYRCRISLSCLEKDVELEDILVIRQSHRIVLSVSRCSRFCAEGFDLDFFRPFQTLSVGGPR